MKKEFNFDNIFENKDEWAAILQASLPDFAIVFHKYMTGQDFDCQDFHDKIFYKLSSYVFGDNLKQNLYLGLPPRAGKSAAINYFVAWTYAINRQCNYISTSYSEKLALANSANVQAIIDSPLFKHLFGVELKAGSASREEWHIKNGGIFRAASLEGTITGYGCGGNPQVYSGALIIDDFLNAGETNSQAQKNKVWELYNDVLKSRRNYPEKTPIIIVAQRIAVGDLIDKIGETEKDDWEFYVVPAYDEENDKSIWEARMPVKMLRDMKERAPYTFYSQYQQTPIVQGGNILKGEWFKYYEIDTKYKYSKLTVTCDTAFKTNSWNDFTCIGLWGLEQGTNNMHLLDMVHDKIPAERLLATVLAFIRKWKNGAGEFGTRISAIYIEDAASGQQLIDDIKKHGIMVQKAKRKFKDRIQEVMQLLIPVLAIGRIYLPANENHPISRKVINECQGFSANNAHKHDDIVDMICYGAQYAEWQRGWF